MTKKQARAVLAKPLDHECRICHQTTSTSWDLEPSAVCNLCAQDLVWSAAEKILGLRR